VSLIHVINIFIDDTIGMSSGVDRYIGRFTAGAPSKFDARGIRRFRPSLEGLRWMCG